MGKNGDTESGGGDEKEKNNIVDMGGTAQEILFCQIVIVSSMRVGIVTKS